VSDGYLSKAVRAEIKSRFVQPGRTVEGAVALTYSADAVKTEKNVKLSVTECADYFIKQSEVDYAK
jgi:hypothetical protein